MNQMCNNLLQQSTYACFCLRVWRWKIWGKM